MMSVYITAVLMGMEPKFISGVDAPALVILRPKWWCLFHEYQTRVMEANFHSTINLARGQSPFVAAPKEQL